MAGCAREWEARRTANMLRSAHVCEAAEEACESVLEHEQSGALPSTGASTSPPHMLALSDCLMSLMYHIARVLHFACMPHGRRLSVLRACE